jgi:hypothetical protein
MTTTIATAALSVRGHHGTSRITARALLAAFALTGGGGASFAADALPLRSVTLYRSGVGYFERTGKIDGGESVTMPLDLNYLNDVLRSLVVLDAGGKSPPMVSYTSSEPLSRLLAGYQIDVGRINTLADLLSQLRGVNLELMTVEGPVRGLMMSVEGRNLREGTTHFVTVFTDSGVKSLDLARVSSFDVLDERVAKDLRDALRTLAQRRAEDRADLTVSFGDGDGRNATLGYIHETPVWKTSYRLVLPEETGGKPILQGWAIVENQTDEDWDDVHLSLVSGRPVAFTMDLRTPLFIARPEIAPPIPGALMSRAYGDAVRTQKATALAAPSSPMLERDASAYANQRFASRTLQGVVAGARAEDAEAEERVAFGGTIAGQATASGATSGEQFRYEIAETVDIGAKSNAMLPILAGEIEGSRVSIYNASDLAEHPMRGVEFTNTSGADLAAGPIVVYDADSYAGDAQVGFTSRGQDRLLSYAVDQDVRALTDRTGDSRVTKVRIVDGMLEQQITRVTTTNYRFINRDASRGRTILVEHPRMPGWDLVEPAKTESESEQVTRFRLELAPGADETMPVIYRRVERTVLAIGDFSIDQLAAYAKNGAASPKVVESIREAQRLRNAVTALEASISRLETERETITRDQSRIRSNMGAVDRNSDLYARYMRTLTEHEDRYGAIDAELETLRVQRDKADAEFRAYLRNLSVE